MPLNPLPHMRLTPPPHIPAASQPRASTPPAAFAAPQPAVPQPPASAAMPLPLPWVEVARGKSSKAPASSDSDAFLDLRISKLRHHNTSFPRQNDVYTLACRIYACLAPLGMTSCTLREALSHANSDQNLLHVDVVQDITSLQA